MCVYSSIPPALVAVMEMVWVQWTAAALRLFTLSTLPHAAQSAIGRIEILARLCACAMIPRVYLLCVAAKIVERGGKCDSSFVTFKNSSCTPCNGCILVLCREWRRRSIGISWVMNFQNNRHLSFQPAYPFPGSVICDKCWDISPYSAYSAEWVRIKLAEYFLVSFFDGFWLKSRY